MFQPSVSTRECVQLLIRYSDKHSDRGEPRLSLDKLLRRHGRGVRVCVEAGHGVGGAGWARGGHGATHRRRGARGAAAARAGAAGTRRCWRARGEAAWPRGACVCGGREGDTVRPIAAGARVVRRRREPALPERGAAGVRVVRRHGRGVRVCVEAGHGVGGAGWARGGHGATHRRRGARGAAAARAGAAGTRRCWRARGEAAWPRGACVCGGWARGGRRCDGVLARKPTLDHYSAPIKHSSVGFV